MRDVTLSYKAKGGALLNAKAVTLASSFTKRFTPIDLSLSVQAQIKHLIELSRQPDPDRNLYRMLPLMLASLATACGGGGGSTISDTNDAPVVDNPIADQALTEDAAFSYTVPANTFSDADGDTLTYNAPNLPSWLSFNANTRELSGTPDNAAVGDYTVQITASDGQTSVTGEVVITVANTNDAPVVANPIADQTATEDAAFNYTVPANTFLDVDVGDTLTYTAPNLPSWLSFNANTGVLSGTPDNAAVGDYTVQITASDDETSVTDDFVITIADTNEAPVVDNPIDDQAATEDAAFNYTVPADTFSDADGDTLTYTASNLPSWLSFNANTGVLSGTPDNAAVGNHTVQIIASDGQTSVTDDFVITVANTNDAPTTSGDAGLNVKVNVPYTLTTADFSASDQDADDGAAQLTWRVTTAPTSGRIALAVAEGTAITSFTQAQLEVGDVVYVDTSTTPGSSSFTVQVEDDGTPTLTADALTVTVTLTENQLPTAPTLSSVLVPSEQTGWVVGRLSSTDADGDKLTWSVSDTTNFIISNDEFLMLDSNVSLKQNTSVMVSVSDGIATATSAFTIIPLTDEGGGTSGSDKLTATKSEWLSGLEGDDELIGSDEADIIQGGAGDDDLRGNGGEDVFVYNIESNGTVLSGVDGSDRIQDFTPGMDRLTFIDSNKGVNDLDDFKTALPSPEVLRNDQNAIIGVSFQFQGAHSGSKLDIELPSVLNINDPITIDEFITILGGEDAFLFG